MPGPIFIVPDPPSGYQGTPETEQENQEALFFGEDIYFDVATPDPESEQASYVVNAAGDWTTVTGLAALKQSLFRRLITNPGEWQTKPNYGVGARQYIKARNTEATRTELASRIKSQFALDKRVKTVDTAVMSRLDDGSPGIKVSVTVTPVGRLRLKQSVTFDWEMR